MNWTGGRLQRHSKANANATLKAQKQYFAKARLPQPNSRLMPSPLRISVFNVPANQSHRVEKEPDQGVKRRRSADSVAPNDHSSKRRCSVQRNAEGSHQADGESEEQQHMSERNHAADPNVPRQSCNDSQKSVKAERTTLNAVKLGLLRRSDWMGLTAARPLHMKFPSPQELENIGRRRRISTKDKKRLSRPLPQINKLHERSARLRCHNTAKRVKSIPADDISIRCGSNIHGTQTTNPLSRVQKEPPPSYQSQSSESMLLDKEISVGQQAREAGSAYNNSLPIQRGVMDKSRIASTRSPLVSLDLVRHSKTFDEVKAMSNSMNKGSLEEQRTDPRVIRRRAANRVVASDEVRSSSIVFGRQLLGSTPLISQTADPLSEAALWGQPSLRRGQVLPHAPDSLSSGFLPPGRRSGQHATQPDFGMQPTTAARTDPEKLEDHSGYCSSSGERLDNHEVSQSMLTRQVEAEEQFQEEELSYARGHHEQDEPWTANQPRFAWEVTRNVLRDGMGAIYNSDKDAQSNSTGSLDLDLRADTSVDGNGLANGNRHDASIVPTLHAEEEQALPGNRATSDLGILRMLESQHNDNCDSVRNESETYQARMPLTPQDDLTTANNLFHFDPRLMSNNGTRQSQHWPRHQVMHDRTLPDHPKLRPVQSGFKGGFGREQSPSVDDNTTISNAVSRPVKPTKTEPLSWLSCLEGQMDNRRLNPSAYTTPAQTERGWIDACSRRTGSFDIDIQNEPVEESSPCDSASIYPSPGQLESQIPNSLSLSSHAVGSGTSATGSYTHRMPLQPIPNVFLSPRRPPFSHGPSHAEHSKIEFGKSSLVARQSEEEHGARDWLDLPSSPGRLPASARRDVNTLPMKYRRMKQTSTHGSQAISTFKRASSSCSIVPNVGYTKTTIVGEGLHHLSHSKTASHALPSSESSIQQQLADDTADPPGKSDSTSLYPPDWTQQGLQTSHLFSPSTSSFITSSPTQYVSTDHFASQKPLSRYSHERDTSQPATFYDTPGPGARAPTTPHLVPFSTPRQLKTPLVPRLEPVPFARPSKAAQMKALSTPRLLRDWKGG